MNNNREPQIKISDPYLDSVKAVQEEIGRLKEIFSWTMTFIIGVLLIGFLTLLFMVVGLVLDTWRFNSSVYKDDNILQLNSNQQKDILERLGNIEKKLKI